MPPQIEDARAKLLRRMNRVLDHLAELDPAAVADYRSARAEYDALGVPAEQRYLMIRGTRDAVRACLEHEGQWLLKRDVAKKMMEGGFVTNPEFGARLIVQSIDKNVQRGHFVVNEAGQVGLPEWVM